jgi:hypothetical protein
MLASLHNFVENVLQIEKRRIKWRVLSNPASALFLYVKQSATQRQVLRSVYARTYVYIVFIFNCIWVDTRWQ